MKRPAVALIAAVALLAATCRLAIGEVFILTTGGRVTGRLLNRDESPREKFVIKTSAGARITLERTQVEKVLRARPVELDYEKIRPRYPDTVEGQWALAEWCYKQRLPAQRKTHLQRIIELDPEHEQARRALGYSQVGGRWVTQEQEMAKRGYKPYKGRYRTSQEIELMENRRKTELAQKEWARKLKRWRSWLGKDKAAEGRRNILDIDDPHAVVALSGNLKSDPSPHARTLYVEALANIGTPEAIKALAACSLEDPIEEVRLTCLDYLEKKKRPEVVAYYAGKLRDKDNRVVNLAAVGLKRMNDPSAIRPLIDALVTTHKYKINPKNPGSITTTFGTGPGGSGVPGGSGLSMGGGPKIVTRQIANQAVLDALVTLTGANFNFDQRTWTYWHASRQKHNVLDARRD